MAKSSPKCSFCGLGNESVKKLIEGPNDRAKVYICDICVDMCCDLLSEPEEAIDFTLREKLLQKIPTPSQLKEHFDQYVVGQENCKRILAIAAHNHYKRLLHEDLVPTEKDKFTHLQKSNVLLLGPSGTGKTYLAQTLAKFLDVPFVIADATTLTEAGYVGADIDSMITALLVDADFDVARAERGIIFVDEADKIARRFESAITSRDISGEGVQQGLLKMIEGTTVNVPQKGNRRNPESGVAVNTHNILFIFGGAFVGLDDIVARRVKMKRIGFAAKELGVDVPDIVVSSAVEPDDLIKFGMIPEFVGRIPVIGQLKELNQRELERVLIEPRNSIISQYQKLFEMANVELIFTQEAISAIAAAAIKKKAGARGLRSIVEAVLADLMYLVPDDPTIRRIVITDRVFVGELPTIVRDAPIAIATPPTKSTKKTKAASS